MKILPLLLSIVLAATAARAQWTQTAGPVGTNLGSVVADDSLLVALIPMRGLYHYNGNAWRHVSDSLIRPDLLVDGVMFGSKAGSGVVLRENYRSTDYGVTWEKLDVPGTISAAGEDLYSIEVDTLFRSTDKGITWSVLGSIHFFSSSLVSHKGEMLASNGFGNLLIRSTDGGVTWEVAECNGSDGGCTVGGLLSTPDVLYSYSGGLVMKSMDGGRFWENISQGLPEWVNLYWMMEDDGILWGGGFSEVFRYNGTRWDKVEIAAGGVQPAIWKDRFIAATAEGLYAIAPESLGIEKLPGEFRYSSIGTMESHNGAVFASANTGVFRTLDLGMTWEKVIADVWPSALISDGVGTLWMIADDLHRSTDNGATWTGMADRFAEYMAPTFTDLTITEDGTLFASAGATFGEHGQTNWTSGGVYRSTDNGATWKDISGNLPFDGIHHIPAYNIWSDGSTLMIITGQGVFRSTNGGTSWSRANAGIPGERLEYFSGSFVELDNALYIFAYTDLYRSVNGGTSWEIVQRPQGYLTYGGGAPSVVDGKAYVTFYQTIGSSSWEYRTFTFDGTTWNDITSTIPDGIVLTSFVRSGNFIFGGSIYDAVWRTESSASSVNTVAIGERGVVMESMPNPFNDESRLRLHLPSRGNATIMLVNAAGEEIAEIHDGMLDAGEHTYTLHGDDLPSGVYFIRARIDDRTTTHMVMKIAR